MSPDPMKALWLRQPYPTLIAIGVKQWETRSYPPNGPMRPKGVRGLPGLPLEPGEPLAIVASKAAPRLHSSVGEWTSVDNGSTRNPRHMFRMVGPKGDRRMEWVALPLGEVVCTVTVSQVVPVVDPEEIQYDTDQAVMVPDEHHNMIAFECPDLTIYGVGCDFWGGGDITDQLPYGDWEPGRWAWRLSDVAPVEAGHVPVVTRGNRQGLCEIEVMW